MPKPNWINRTLWTGDNLDVMRGMNSDSVDLIYLDPPFNSNRLYAAPIGSEAAGAAFKDTWTLSDVDDAWHGEVAERHPAMYRVIDAAGLTHGDSMKSYLIMMAVRLLEMRRLLKSTGSLYLHCDPTASHYLKTLLDAVFGNDNFRSEIVWKRTSAHSSARRFGPAHDMLIFYSKSEKYTWNRVFQPYDQSYVNSFYRYTDAHGRYRVGDLTGAGVRRGESGASWRGHDPTIKGRHWAPPRRFPGGDAVPAGVLDALDYLDGIGRIHWPSRAGGVPGFKRYLNEMQGMVAQDVITDIPPVSPKSRELTGYPTQKPLALLQRIIEASSNEGDMVLDPFCGCATTLVAADRLGRQWAGIDLSETAVRLVKMRLSKESESLGPVHVYARSDIPIRADMGDAPDYRTQKHLLYGRQEGKCAGCLELFPFRNMTIDHIVARARGGSDYLPNLQLLCGACNSTKGAGTQEALIVKLRQQGVR